MYCTRVYKFEYSAAGLDLASRPDRQERTSSRSRACLAVGLKLTLASEACFRGSFRNFCSPRGQGRLWERLPASCFPSSPLPPQTTPLSRLLGGVLKTGEGVRVGVGEELGVARHGVARPHGRRAAEDGAPGYRLPVLGENLLYLGVVPLPPKAHSPQTLDSTRARELLRKKTLPVGHDPPTRQQRPLDLDPPHPNRPSPSSRAAPLSLSLCPLTTFLKVLPAARRPVQFT